METPPDDQRQDYEDLNGPPLIGPPVEKPAPAYRASRKTNYFAFAIGILIPLTCFGVLLAPSVCGVRNTVQRLQSNSSLKQIGLAIHNFNDCDDELPQNTYTQDGKPMLSWRVHILPFIEEENLYKLFRLDEPWDSPNNLPLLQKMPKIYAHPANRNKKGVTVTHYRGFSSTGAVFERRPTTPPWQHLFVGPAGVLPRPMPLRPAFNLNSIKDGLSNTILVVEAADPVEWSKPDDLDASGNVPFPKLGGLWKGDRFNALFGDGSVRALKIDIPEETLRALITHSGGEPIPSNWDQ